MPAGFDTKAAFVREPDLFTRTWPSPAPGVATELLAFFAESVSPELQQQGVATVDQQAQSAFPIVLRRNGSGEALIDTRYHGLEFFWAAALGFEAKRIDGVLMPEDLGGGAFRHLIEIDPDLHGTAWQAGDGWIAGEGLVAGQQKLRRGTFVSDKSVETWETLSCMLNGFSLNGNGGAGVTVSTQLVGYQTSQFSFVNDLSGLICRPERVLYPDMTFQLGSAAPLTQSDLITEVTGINLALNNNLRAPITRDTGTFIDEPARAGALTVQGTFAIPTYLTTNDQLSEDLQNQTELVGLIEFVGDPIAASGFDYTLRFWLPSVKITSVDIVVQGPQQLQQNYGFVCAKPESTPAGFPDNLKGGSLMVELINDTAAHPLID